ncbi:FAD-dependent oxidoreductase [Hyphomicrobium sp.]|uniref:FAD-dependent oxidoreductase n=1 Tax=Hyphomicrobium sp. TaxID=82 RepID=UPI002FDCD562
MTGSHFSGSTLALLEVVKLHSGERLQIAIVGSGPSGFYAAEALLASGLDIQVDMFERLPTPYGLVRSGVAPDHQKLKQPIRVFEEIARSPRFNLVANVTVGGQISVEELQSAYHAIVFACGAQNDRRMNVPGEDLKGSHTATEFVGWYNGHPDYRDRTFDLDQEVAVIIGQGNVAADICRILMRPVDELKSSDIAEHALEALSRSKVREVHIVGRRGPVQAKFTTKELRELASLTGTVSTIEPEQLALSEACDAELASPKSAVAKRNLDVFRSLTENIADGSRRRIHFRFLASPVALLGEERVERLRLVRNRLSGAPFDQTAVATEQHEDIPCGLAFRSIGYKGVPIPGLPFDAERGVVPNTAGRVHADGAVVPGLFVTGWIKRGPSGIIGTNKADSLETVHALLEDLSKAAPARAPGLEGVLPIIESRSGRVVSLSDWFAIDGAEVERGSSVGKPREKFTRIGDMLAILPPQGRQEDLSSAPLLETGTQG